MAIDPLDTTSQDLRQLKSNLEVYQRQTDDITRLLAQFSPDTVYAFDSAGTPNGYRVLMQHSGSWQGLPKYGGPAWPFKVYNTSVGTTGQVQINGGDGFVASLNSFVANVNGQPNNVQSGAPLAYPQLSVTGNGVIYLYAVPQTLAASGLPVLTSLDIYYGGSVPSPDTSNPQSYFALLLATITGYTAGKFNLANNTNYGYTELEYCDGNLIAL